MSLVAGKAAIIGARAYTAAALAEMILRHPWLELGALQARVEAPEDFADTFPQFRGRAGIPPVLPVDPAALGDDIGVAFLCLPHTASAAFAKPLLEAGKLVIDLSADFRFADHRAFEDAYGVSHPAPELCPEAVYGLAEINRPLLSHARLVACPGCYPTAVILALAPLLRRDLVRGRSVIADCKSGVSGAGRTPTDLTHFCSANENFMAYKVASHRHQPEIEEQLSRIAAAPCRATFVPHLVPMDRGLYATCYVDLAEPMEADDLRRLYAEFYNDAPFVRLLPPGAQPQARAIARTNFCDIALAVDARAQRLVATSAIDNLVKGASGQALQCYNIAVGGEETDGLL